MTVLAITTANFLYKYYDSQSYFSIYMIRLLKIFVLIKKTNLNEKEMFIFLFNEYSNFHEFVKLPNPTFECCFLHRVIFKNFTEYIHWNFTLKLVKYRVLGIFNIGTNLQNILSLHKINEEITCQTEIH